MAAMKKSIVRYIALLMLMLTVALSAAMPINAAEYLDISKPATLTVQFRPEDISAADVRFELFKVADVNEYAELTLTKKFENIPVDLSSPDSGVWASAVEEAETCVSANSLKADYSAVTDKDGNAVFGKVSAGLYLLRGESFIKDHDVYKPQSYLIMLPNRADDGSWDHDVTSIPKFDKSDELVDLKVTKKWVGGRLSSRPTEITVILFCNDAEYESVILNADNNWQHTWPQLNAKNNWTVSETSVEGYTTTIENDGYSYIITNKSTTGGLPQTGMIWWHIPLIAAVGIGFCFAGLLLMKKNKKSA